MSPTILHIITGLSVGGAESMLLKLVTNMDPSLYNNKVVSLTEKGVIGLKLEEEGIEVFSLGMAKGIPHPSRLWKLVNIIREVQPDLIQTWMYHADLIGSIASVLVRNKTTLLWNIRHSNLDRKKNKRLTNMTAKCCAALSEYIPDGIVCCSNASVRTHEKLGYDTSKMVVIPNGFDLDLFKPDFEKRRALKNNFNISDNYVVLGMVARFDHQKDHYSFFKAFRELRKRGCKVACILCGNKVEKSNPEIVSWFDDLGLDEDIYLLGTRSDVSNIMNSLDVFVLSSSYGEGFPNVLGEAMACEVPCVATNVGDSAEIVGKTGRVVTPNDYLVLASELEKIINMGERERRKLGISARKRVYEHFRLSKIVEKYQSLYDSFLKE